VRFKHVILDQDGVIIREAPDSGYVLSPAEFHWIARSLDALAPLRRSGVRLSVATNRSAVGRGLIDRDQLEAIHAQIRAEAPASGRELNDVFYGPQSPDAGCDCRNPAPCLKKAAVSAAGIDGAGTRVVGDDTRDVVAAIRAGVRAALVRTGKGLRAEILIHDIGVIIPVYDDLLHLARAIDGDAI
jgi:D-glycero-D-manno-heptose 1,7-bisphosphate phosphatase